MKKFLFIAFASLVTLATDTSCMRDNFYTVTFKSQGGTPVNSVWVREGSRIRRPDDPTKEGSTFLGWYYTSRSGVKWNFETNAVYSNLILYAHWNSNGLDALISLVSNAETLLQADYTVGSWVPLQRALGAAKTITDNPNTATAAQISAAATALQTAFDNLVYIGDLNTAIAVSEALTASNYTPASWSALQTALSAAKAVAVNPNATKSDVERVVAALQTAFDGLVPA